MRRAALLLVALLLGSAPIRAGGPPAPAVAPAKALPAHANSFYEAEQFYRGLKEALALPAPAEGGAVVGGVVPHHILAGSMFTRFYRRLERQPPATLIVVGPNHENRGARVATGRQAWATDFGTVAVDHALVDRLVAAGLATVDDDALATEHSVGAQMPYVAYHAPGARVVPLILHRDVSPHETKRLAEFLAPLLGPERVLVASADFSHYRTSTCQGSTAWGPTTWTRRPP